MPITLNGTTGITTPALTNSGALTQTGAATLSSTLQAATTIGVGGATPSTSGAGITFPATQSASSDANTLDDYEEGTWTPSIGGTATYSSRSGVYTKVGNIVNISFDITIGTIGTGSQRVINNIPFTVASASSSGGNVGYWEAAATSIVYITARVDANGTNLVLDANSSATTTVTGVNVFTSGTRVIGTVTYRAA